MTNILQLPPRSWKDGLIVTKHGSPKPNLFNSCHALRYAPDWLKVLEFDDFAKCTMIMSCPPWQMPCDFAPRRWAGQDDLSATEWFQANGINVTLGVAANAVEKVADENSFHPVLEYLDSLEWDKVPRLNNWMWVNLGAANDDYTRTVARCTLIAAIARVRQPGAKVDNMPILEGLQGIGKSSIAEALFWPWFSDEIADLGSKDAGMQMQGVWMIEIAELDAMSRNEVSRIKAFISRRKDRFRPPYGRRVEEFPRQSVFWGTTNSVGYLKDETGARRFWPIKCGKLDLVGLKTARDQLWAEADEMYRSGAQWWINDPKVLATAEAEQASRYQGDSAWDDLVSAFIEPLESVTVHDVLLDAVFVPTESQDQTKANRVARILQHMGWERYKAGTGKDRQWRYRRAGSSRTIYSDTPISEALRLAKKAGFFIRAAMELTEGRMLR
jgi:predicted P-loop ATPase